MSYPYRDEDLELIPLRKDHMRSANMQRYVEQVRREAYEKGKVDILEALKAEAIMFLRGVQVPTDSPVVRVYVDNVRGWLVFIPEEALDGAE